MTTTSNGQGYQEWESSLPGKKEISVFIYSRSRFRLSETLIQ